MRGDLVRNLLVAMAWSNSLIFYDEKSLRFKTRSAKARLPDFLEQGTHFVEF
ncbi:MAG: hypothetical protein RJA81_819, partial [Planctomycetota bacterium]